MAASASPGDPSLARAVARAVEGEVCFDALTRGLYSTDASHYQIEPLGVVFPRSIADVQAVMAIARERGVPVLPRGAGTSQCGQTIGRAIVLDTHRHLNAVGGVDFDPAELQTTSPPAQGADIGMTPRPSFRSHAAASIDVGPGVVLDHLNRTVGKHDLWFPVDPSTSSRATLGGMAGNNSAGARSIRYGMMVDNVLDMEVVLADGRRLWLGEAARSGAADALAAERSRVLDIHARNADEIRRRAPRTMRNVAGYNLDRIGSGAEGLAPLMVGSEGTLAFFSRLRLALAERPRTRVLGVCHFPDLVQALDAVQHLVVLGPSAVELVDSNVLRLAAEQPDFRSAMAGFVRGTPGALLLVEFASSEAGADLSRDLARLEDLMGEIGHPNAVVRAETAQAQAAVWRVRKAGLNIVMSMAGPRKPISFIEDCAVPLEHLAEYATEVDAIFRRHGTDGTWYAHASVGCLHVRPALNLRDPDDVASIRRIAEETHEVVRRFDGTHSGEHGDGILRSEFLAPMVGRQLVEAYREVKETFDPLGLMNPGKIVDPPAMDDRALFRFHPQYASGAAAGTLPVVLDWRPTDGLLGATERCNNNGACRQMDPGVMCPSFRATGEERHSTRGRANALRLALTGQLGDGGLDSQEMVDAMSLCISCKACRRECPTGVDMSRMKIEWQHDRNTRVGLPIRDRVLAGLPRIAPRIAPLASLANVAGRLPGRGLLGLSPRRSLPRWSPHPWRDEEIQRLATPPADAPGSAVMLFVDTFSRWFEPENARAAATLLSASGATVSSLRTDGERPLCCGRTYLSAGMVDEARAEATRLLAAALPMARAGHAVVGIEPSCLYTLRDEFPALLPGPDTELLASRAMTVTEYLDSAWAEGRELRFEASPAPRRVLRHGHCHQKAFDGVAPTDRMLARVPGVELEAIESGCCGMAGAFGYHAEHYATSMAIGELGLLPQVREAAPETSIVADGTSCRAQIEDGVGRTAVHSAILLAGSLAGR